MNDHPHPEQPHRHDTSLCAGKNTSTRESSVDPVCGMIVDPATASHHLQHAGEHHYFCSARCLEKFRADPDTYLHPQSNPQAVDVPEGT
ncbi:MAG: YHS domain-containing protein, partial [Dokdonella sp.]